MARLVVPGLPLHITQRGVRSMNIFADDADRKTYLDHLRREGRRCGLRFLSWCLMKDHVHMVVVPEKENSLSRGIGEAHRFYTRARNLREGVRGTLFQGRFGSCVLDEGHLLASARYVDLNPVRARVVERPEEYPWSSARFHLGRRRKDPLVEDRTLLGLVPDGRAWRELLDGGVDEIEAGRIEMHLSTGRPLGDEGFVKRLEERTGRSLAPRRGGWPKGKPRGRRARSK